MLIAMLKPADTSPAGPWDPVLPVDPWGMPKAKFNVAFVELPTFDTVAVADLQKELFSGDNVVIDKNTDHGLSDLINKEKKED